MTSRRITLQLTPLLDLMLIVIFAQYLDVQEQSRRQTIAQATQVAGLEADLTDARHTADQLRQSQLETRDTIARLHRERDTIAALLPELFQLPQPVADRLMESRARDLPGITAPRMEQLKADFQTLATASPDAAARHVLTWDEIRRRCDLWELHIFSNGVTRLTAGTQSVQFRAETAATFESALFEQYRRLPQPRAMVILLLSHGNVRADVYEAALSGVPKAVARMSADQNSRTRFEYGVIGFSPDPPSGPQ